MIEPGIDDQAVVYCDDETAPGLPCGHPSRCQGHLPGSDAARFLVGSGAALIDSSGAGIDGQGTGHRA